MKYILALLITLSFSISSYAKGEGAIIGGIIGVIIGNEIDKSSGGNNHNRPPRPIPPRHHNPGHGGYPPPNNGYNPGYPPANNISCQVVGSDRRGSWSFQSCGQCLSYNQLNCQETCTAGGAATCKVEGRDYYGNKIKLEVRQADLNTAQRSALYECQRRGGQNCQIRSCKSERQQVVSQRNCRY